MSPDHAIGPVPSEIAARVLDLVDALVIVLDQKGRVILWNPACEQVTGRSAASTIGKRLWLLPDADGDVLRAAIDEVRYLDASTTVETRWPRRDGVDVVIRWTLKPLPQDDSRIPLTIVTGAVVTDLRQAERELRERERQLAIALHDATAEVRALEQSLQMEQIFEASTDLIAQCDPDGEVWYLNQAALDFFGGAPEHLGDVLDASSEAVFRDQVLAHLDDEDVWRGEMVLLAADGSKAPVSQLFVTHRDHLGAIERISMIARDISEAKALQHDLSHRAFHDPLTGLPNRALLDDRLRHGLGRIARGGASLAVLFLDLDYFKAVNDRLGHEGGDELLRLAAQRIQSSVRPADTVARLGGDEFVVLAELADAREALRIAERVRSALARPFTILGETVHSSGSIGVAVGAPGTRDPDTLLSQADRASYRAKERGRNRAEIWREESLDGA